MGRVELRVGDVVEFDGNRRVRICGMPDGVTVCRDWRKRIAVRNVDTNRLSYIPERRFLMVRVGNLKSDVLDLYSNEVRKCKSTGDCDALISEIDTLRDQLEMVVTLVKLQRLKAELSR